MILFEDKNVRGKHLALACNSFHYPTNVESERAPTQLEKLIRNYSHE